MVPKLTITEKIIVHLYQYRKYNDRYEYPKEMTQQGIANSVGISVTHVPRNMKKLREEGLVEIKKGHVPGKKKRVTIYFLTSSGILKAKEIIKKIEETEIEIDGEYMNIEEIKKLTGKSLIEIINLLEKGEKIRVLTGKRIVFREIKDDDDKFIDRTKELEIMKKWYSSGKILVIIGPRGIGKTMLVNQFLKKEDISLGIVLFHIYEGRSWSSIKDILQELFGKREVLKILREFPTLLIFDNYYLVDDDFVDAMKSLIIEDIGDSKIIVTMPSSTPYYNRFYTLQDVKNGTITEIDLGPIEYEHAKKLLPDIREDAFKRIYQLTKGNTKILSLLAKGNLKSGPDIPLTPETVHLLNYLASQKNKNSN